MCHKVINPTDLPVNFTFIAYDNLNKDNGLLLESRMTEVNEENNLIVHTIDSSQVFEIMLRGKHGTEMTKANRLLPERIEIVIQP